MLFCDVKGSTAAAEQLDPEEWAEIMNGAFEHMIRPIYKYEGTVARLMGDAILAFFGAPIAHEDDPERGILAGLDILDSIDPYRREVRQQWAIEIDVRVGINTGLVVVGAVGSDLRMEYTALGDAINLASRMEQLADPGTVRISEHTFRLVAPLFDAEDLGEIEVRGKDRPVRTYRVLSPKAQPGRLRGVEGLESPLIGRDAEMHTLRGAIIDLRQGRGKIVSVMGEAGLGKSRLIAELRQSPTPVSGANVELRWLEGRSLSYETTSPYAPFIDILTEIFSLQQEQSETEKYERMRVAVLRIAGDRTADIVPFLASMLEIQPPPGDYERVRFLEPPQLRQRVFAAMSELVERMALARPTVLVLDDIHWIDSTSLDLLLELLPLTDRTPLLVLAIFRPRRHEPSWQFHETAAREFGHRYAQIPLHPLDEGSASQLVSSLLHIEDLPESVSQLILEKAEGNPLLDAGLVVKEGEKWRATGEIEGIAVPDTLAAVITTRLDRLDQNSKHVVQTASVIGREFVYETLATAQDDFEPLERSLTDLQRRELIREKSRRRELHLRVAECLEGLQPERVAEIARHFMEARLPERALPYLLDAGDHAAHAYSTPEAIGFYQQAIEIVGTGEDMPQARRAYEGLGGALTFANDIPRALQTYQSMLELADENNAIPMQVSALNKMSFLSALRLGQFQEAENYLREADTRARAEQDKVGLSEMSIIRCMMCTAAADFEGVVHYMGEAVGLAKDLGVKEQMALGLAHIASSQAYMLEFEEAWRTAQEGLALTREIGDLEHEAEILSGTVPIYHLRNGDLEAAYKAAEQAMMIALKIGSIQMEMFSARMMGDMAHHMGAYEDALASFQQYLDASRKVGAAWGEAEALCHLGTIFLEVSPGLLDRVKEYHDQASLVMEKPGGAMLGGTAWAELGFCNFAVGKLEEAAELFEKGLTLPTITTSLERPRLLAGAALVALERSELEKANGLLREADAMVREHGMKNHAPRIDLVWAKLSLAQGETQEALDHFRRAEETARHMGMRPFVLQAQAEAAELLLDQGKEQEGLALRHAANDTVEEIAGLFEDEELRDGFLMNTTLTLGV
jgi:class 3 adenylate cyclase/predicted ATPase